MRYQCVCKNKCEDYYSFFCPSVQKHIFMFKGQVFFPEFYFSYPSPREGKMDLY